MAFAAKIYLDFLLVPLILAYFVTFLLAPLMDIVENRPYSFGANPSCANKFASLELWEPKQGEFPIVYYAKKAEDYTDEEIDDGKGGTKKTGQQIWNAPEQSIIDKRSVMTTEQWEAAKDRVLLEGGARCVADLTQTLKLPHMMAVLFCLGATSVILYGIFALITGEFAAFAAQEQKAVEAGEASISEKLLDMANEQIVWLEANAVKVYRDVVCPRKDLSALTVTASIVTDPDSELGNYVDFVINSVETIKNQVGNDTHSGFDYKTDNCYRKPVFGPSCRYTNPNRAYQLETGEFPAELEAPYLTDYCDPYGDLDSWDEFMGSVGAVGEIVNLLVLVMLLALYILLERPEGRTISGDHVIMMEIEDMVKSYIVMKTMLSILTGGLSGLCLGIAGVPMAGVFGLLSTLLNYIPSVGSMIAMVLPIPIIILDPVLAENPAMFYLALIGPCAVQGYIGNVLEPAVFGASLNLTALSILMALIFYGAVWGLSGAVISVPLLGAAKIVMHHTDHPMAQYSLMLLREDPSIP
eukprot:SAG22_NODE_210_length_15092_cov_81.740946_2_plen_526_part_00